MLDFASYPTPPGAALEERMSAGFVKLHPGAPVHVFTEAADEFFHSHPFNFTSHVIAGSYTEEILLPHADGTCHIETVHRAAGTSHHVLATTVHRVTGLPEGFCVTRAEYGPTTQTPGFYALRPHGIYHRFWNEEAWHAWPRR